MSGSAASVILSDGSMDVSLEDMLEWTHNCQISNLRGCQGHGSRSRHVALDFLLRFGADQMNYPFLEGLPGYI